jgi:hypothetical protein
MNGVSPRNGRFGVGPGAQTYRLPIVRTIYWKGNRTSSHATLALRSAHDHVTCCHTHVTFCHPGRCNRTLKYTFFSGFRNRRLSDLLRVLAVELPQFYSQQRQASTLSQHRERKYSMTQKMNARDCVALGENIGYRVDHANAKLYILPRRQVIERAEDTGTSADHPQCCLLQDESLVALDAAIDAFRSCATEHLRTRGWKSWVR